MKASRALIAVAVLLVAIGWGISSLFKPANYGIQASSFLAVDAPAPLLSKKQTASALPNIIVILADDLGYGDVGAYGGKVIQTPHIDQLANDGMHFTNAYSSAPICSPSRAGLLTGRYPLRTGIVQAMQAAGDSLARRLSYQAGLAMSNFGSIDMRGGGNMVNGLPQVELTMAEMLKQAGYGTAAFGKWHLGDFTEWSEYHPFKHGFDHFVGFNMSNDDWPVAFYEGENKVIEDIGLDQQRYTALFTQEAIAYIESVKDKPFFVYLSHKDPHQPFFPSQSFSGISAGGPYGDAVSEFDWSVGEIRATLERLGIAQNTLLIVTSDNGPWFEGSSGGLRGRKGQSYEGGFRVPLLAWWPGVIDGGGEQSVPVMNIDLLPTFAVLAGLGLPDDRTIDGQDISPLLFNQSHDLADRPLYFFHDYDIEGVRIGDWKYLASNSHYVWPNPLDKTDSLAGQLISTRDYSPSNSNESIATLGNWPLLYHLGRDPNEAYNVAEHYPERRTAMEKRLEKWRSDFYADPRQIRLQ